MQSTSVSERLSQEIYIGAFNCIKCFFLEKYLFCLMLNLIVDILLSEDAKLDLVRIDAVSDLFWTDKC
jgi:hypothetical protein